ncbi:MAG: hypothetical protein ABSG90_05580 [Dehalococcoidia bacterium]|jgi:hypothetical protein
MEISWAQIAQIVIAIVALYGAVISTYNLVIARSKGKRKIKVQLSYGYFIAGASVVTYPTYSDLSTHLIVGIVNIGFRPVTVKQLHFTLPKHNEKLMVRRPQSHVELPHEFTEGEACTFWIELGDIVGGIYSLGYEKPMKLAISALDTTENITKSNSIEFNVNQLVERFKEIEHT